MNKNIKDLIDQYVFKGENILQYDIELIESYDEDTEVDIIFKIDHYKLWKSSGYFDPKYYELIVGLDNGDMELSLDEFLPMVGYNSDYIRLLYEPINKKDIYKPYERLFDALEELGYEYTYSVYKTTPWLNVYVTTPNDENFYNIIETLQDEYDLDIDDIVLLDI